MFAKEVGAVLARNRIIICGLGLCFAWFYSAFFSCSLVSVSYQDALYGSDTYWSIAVLAMSISTILVLRFSNLRTGGNRVWVYTLLSAIGTIVIRYGFYSEEFHIQLYWLGAIMAGFGFGAIIMLWIEKLGHCRTDDIEVIVPAAFLAAFALYFLVFSLKCSLGVWFMILFLALSSIMLRLEKTSGTSQDSHRKRHSAKDTMTSRSYTHEEKIELGKLLVLFIILWLGFGLLRVFTAPGFYDDRSLYYCVPFSVGLILSMCIVVFSMRFSRSMGLATVLKWVLALYPLGYAVDYALGGGSAGGLIGYAIGCTAMLVMQICVFIAIPKDARNCGQSICVSMAVYFIGQGLGAFTGVAIGKFLSVQFDYVWPFEAVLLSISLFVGGGLAMMPFTCHPNIVGAKKHSSSDNLSAGESAALDDPFTAFAAMYNLSPREEEVGQLLSRGYSRSRIRDELFISLNTVSTHVKSIYSKTGVHSQSELLAAIRDHSASSNSTHP